ncbi:MAG: Fe-S-containing hydro-lyase [Deltaproteobacteria bacterium]|nr:Fe-S-containing hydro-lyase [Deltaproteobacteria bacterium]MBW2051764.1 Fe-S-containing hydro-lyase [Deltaproteobacteria bacterium]MBW2322366.1 Fe-S-containing hydro-lyase [Deltaproteobacteria bacterium]
MTVTHRLQAPLRRADLEPLQAGDLVLFSGTVYTARDAAHKRLVEAIDQGDPLPMDLNGQIIYYVGPTPARPERVIGAAGPTTSYRMDAYTEALLKLGLKVMIGKGRRSEEVKKAMIEYGAVYLAAVGGAGALLSLAIKSVEVIAYPDLGPEAVRKLTVEDFPATVINDLAGRDLYEEGKKRYKKGNKQ